MAAKPNNPARPCRVTINGRKVEGNASKSAWYDDKYDVRVRAMDLPFDLLIELDIDALSTLFKLLPQDEIEFI